MLSKFFTKQLHEITPASHYISQLFCVTGPLQNAFEKFANKHVNLPKTFTQISYVDWPIAHAQWSSNCNSERMLYYLLCHHVNCMQYAGMQVKSSNFQLWLHVL